MRELVYMAEARGRHDWNQTSSLMALIVNIVRDPKRSPSVKPSEFNPYIPQAPKPVLKGKELEILKDIFVTPYMKK